MIVTSTNTIENFKITEYLGLINANIVIGGNLISEFFASFTDALGGYSNSYQKRLDKIYDKALNELKTKAQTLQADAIIGLHFEFDEISGKGMSMFMVTAYGTAVKITSTKENTRKDRYEIYQKLYNLSKFKEACIITSEQYEAERNNLLLNYEDEIEEELKTIKSHNDQKEAIKQAQILTKQLEEKRRKEQEILFEQKKKEEEAKRTAQEIETALKKEKEALVRDAIVKFKTKAPSIFVQVRNLLDINIKSPKFTLDNLSYNQIINANYDEMNIAPSEKLAYTIGRFIKEEKIAAACKYYIDTVNDDDIEYAKSYIYSVYEIITFKKQSAFEIMALNLVELKCLGKEEEAVNEFVKYSVCDIEVARQVIALL